MKITHVRVYQAVKLGKKIETYFPTMRNGSAKSFEKFKILEGVGVLISEEDNHVVVPWPNVAYMEVEPEEDAPKAGDFKVKKKSKAKK